MMDLHAHSLYSDGSASVQEIVAMAKKQGLAICSITDHDCVDGVQEAIAEGQALGVCVISGIELSLEFECELHMLGYGFDPNFKELRAFMLDQDQKRDERNQKIFGKLHDLGVDVEVTRDARGTLISRTHIADAIAKAGYANSIQDAFVRYLGPGAPARFEVERLCSADAIELIHAAGGVCVLAHPGQLLVDCEQTVKQLSSEGLDGIEAHYASHYAREVAEFRDMATRYNLFVTTGSDYHGEYRRYAKFGAVAELASFDPMIQETEAFFLSMTD